MSPSWQPGIANITSLTVGETLFGVDLDVNIFGGTGSSVSDTGDDTLFAKPAGDALRSGDDKFIAGNRLNLAYGASGRDVLPGDTEALRRAADAMIVRSADPRAWAGDSQDTFVGAPCGDLLNGEADYDLSGGTANRLVNGEARYG